MSLFINEFKICCSLRLAVAKRPHLRSGSLGDRIWNEAELVEGEVELWQGCKLSGSSRTQMALRTCSKLPLGRQCSHAWCSSLHPKAILTEELSGKLSAVKDVQQLAQREGSIRQSLHSRIPLVIWLKWQMAGLQLEMISLTSFLSHFLHAFTTLSRSTSLINHLCGNSHLKICLWQITGKRMSTIWLNSILSLLPNVSP